MLLYVIKVAYNGYLQDRVSCADIH